MSIPYPDTGPHIHSHDSIVRTMWKVIVALVPAIAAAVFFFGFGALYPILGTAFFSVLFEVPFVPRKYTWRQPLGDGSACVAGLILGLSLSPGGPWWVPPVGALILVTIGKQVFGGIGNNLFNPALVARGILLLAWPAALTTWVTPFDGIAGATPLETLDASLQDLFTGHVAGSLGETSTLAILIGAVYLVRQGLIRWKVPVATVLGAIVAAYCFGVDPLFSVLAGSLFFGAVFMATDMTTSPTGKTAHLVFGFGCGFLTIFIRTYTVYPEGVTFAFLFMNGFAYLLDRLGADPIFGRVHERKKRMLHIGLSIGAVVIVALAVASSRSARQATRVRYADTALTRAVRLHFPDADRIIPMADEEADAQNYRVYAGRKIRGRFGEQVVPGYGGPMHVQVMMTPDGVVEHVHIADHHESPTLGTAIRHRSFLSQFAGFDRHTRSAIREQVEGLSGATISSRAVMTAVERVLGDAAPSTVHATLPSRADGTYAGAARGYQGMIHVTVTVARGAVTTIEVTEHHETPGIGSGALETMRDRIMDAQSLAVDGVSGATGSSDGIRAAVADALQP